MPETLKAVLLTEREIKEVLLYLSPSTSTLKRVKQKLSDSLKDLEEVKDYWKLGRDHA